MAFVARKVGLCPGFCFHEEEEKFLHVQASLSFSNNISDPVGKKPENVWHEGEEMLMMDWRKEETPSRSERESFFFARRKHVCKIKSIFLKVA